MSKGTRKRTTKTRNKGRSPARPRSISATDPEWHEVEQFAARRIFEPKLHHACAAFQQDARKRNGLVARSRIDHRIEMRGEFHLIASRGVRG